MAIAPSSADARSSTKQKSLKKEKREEKTELKALPGTEEKKGKKKYRGEDEDAQQLATPTADDERPRKKKQKVEQEDSNAGNEVTPDSTNNTSSPLKPPKREKRPKKPKDKTTKPPVLKEETVSVLDKIHIVDIPVPYTNPLTDASLPELSQRGLAYAYQYAQHISLPSDAARAAQQPWKFNKGRQNWILRNVTDPAVIPSSYLALAMIYIDSIKGGARDALKKTCKKTTKDAKAAVEDQPEPNQQKSSDETAEAEIDKSASKKVAFAAATKATPTSTPVSDEKRRRAKKILKVLRGKIQPQDI